MTVIEELRAIVDNTPELIKWINKTFGEAVQSGDCCWNKWFDVNYCKKCPGIDRVENGKTLTYAYCELHDDCCKYNATDESIIEGWLNSEVTDD